MRLGAVVVVALAGSVGVAAADDYPVNLPDRPILLLPGMTRLELAEDFSSSTTSALSNRQLDLDLAHAIGDVQVGVDLGFDATVDVDLDTHAFGVLELAYAAGAPQADHTLHQGQTFDLEEKLHLVPGSFALYVEAGVTLNENRIVDPSGALVWTHTPVTYGLVEPQLQVARHLALHGLVSGNAPFAQSASVHFASALFANVGAIVILGRWDLFASYELEDVTNRRLPFVNVGFEKRWEPRP